MSEAIDALKIEIEKIKSMLDNPKPCQSRICPASAPVSPPVACTSQGFSQPHTALHSESQQLSQGKEPSLSQADSPPKQGGLHPSPVLNEDLDISVVSLDQVVEEFDFSSNDLN